MVRRRYIFYLIFFLLIIFFVFYATRTYDCFRLRMSGIKHFYAMIMNTRGFERDMLSYKYYLLNKDKETWANLFALENIVLGEEFNHSYTLYNLLKREINLLKKIECGEFVFKCKDPLCSPSIYNFYMCGAKKIAGGDFIFKFKNAAGGGIYDIYTMRFSKRRLLEVLYFRMCDVYFRTYRIEEGKRYLKKALELGVRDALSYYFWKYYSDYDHVKYAIKESVKDPEKNLSYEEKLFFFERCHVYIEKSMDEVKDLLKKMYPDRWEEIYLKFLRRREKECDKRMLAIIKEEAKREYWEISVKRYFEEYRNKLLKEKLSSK